MTLQGQQGSNGRSILLCQGSKKPMDLSLSIACALCVPCLSSYKTPPQYELGWHAAKADPKPGMRSCMQHDKFMLKGTYTKMAIDFWLSRDVCVQVQEGLILSRHPCLFQVDILVLRSRQT